MKDKNTGMGFLYGHLKDPTPLSVGDSVSVGQFVGIEGTTGHSTGNHVHVELQDLSNHDWVFGADKSYYSNPAEFMGFPNTEGITVIYYGNSLPPIVYKKIKKHFKWVLYARKLRNKTHTFNK